MNLNSKYTILSIFLLCLIASCTIYYIGKSNDADSESDFESFNNSIQLIQSPEAEKIQQAEDTLDLLNNKYPNNFPINAILGFVYAQSGNYNAALSYYQKCLKLNPTAQLDANFMFQFGEVLYLNGEKEEAKIILEKSLHQIEANPDKAEIKKLLLKLS